MTLKKRDFHPESGNVDTYDNVMALFKVSQCLCYVVGHLEP